MIPKKIIQKCRRIKVVITDVDGVLTDGVMYFSEKGELLKKFNTRDGMAIELLHKFSIKSIFLTGENSKIVKARASKVRVDEFYVNIKRKEVMLSKISKKFNVKRDNVAYIGDDINDIKIMKLVGFSGCTSDSTKEAKSVSDFICKTKGGQGALREFVDLILSANGFI